MSTVEASKKSIDVSLWRRYTTRGAHRQYKKRVWRFVPIWLRGLWGIGLIAEVFIYVRS